MGKKDDDGRVHLYVCTGGDCKDNNAKKLRSRLKDVVKERELKERVKVEECSCVGRCGKGPVVVVEPGGEYHERLKPRDAERIIGAVVS